MEEVTLLFVVKVNLIKVYEFKITTVTNWGTAIVEVPPGLIDHAYQHLQIEVTKKGGN